MVGKRVFFFSWRTGKRGQGRLKEGFGKRQSRRKRLSEADLSSGRRHRKKTGQESRK